MTASELSFKPLFGDDGKAGACEDSFTHALRGVQRQAAREGQGNLRFISAKRPYAITSALTSDNEFMRCEIGWCSYECREVAAASILDRA
ncbi:hypothetical protein D3C72_1765110 [compost metagenome]